MGGLDLDKLYDNYNILSEAKEKASEHPTEYLEAIQGTKGDEKLKKLAAQIISKFFKYFPDLQCQAVDAMFDLCEDDNTAIRIAGMKALPSICKENKEFIGKIADILAQLLQLNDPQEYNIACTSLLQVLQEDPITVIKCIYKQINLLEMGNVRAKCIKFLTTKIKTLDKALYTTELEDVIIEETKKTLQDTTAEEFMSLFQFLTTTRLGSSISGQQELVDLAAAEAELDQDFDPLDKENNPVDRLLTCIKYVLPMFSSKVDSQRFVKYICDQVLPQWDAIAKLEQGQLFQLAILRQLAELSTHCGKLDHPAAYVVQIFDKTKAYMPPPPEDANLQTMPYLDFTAVECLLYAFHRLARQCPDFLTHDPQVLKDFRARLMYFSRGLQGCNKALKNLDVKNKTLTDEEKKKAELSPKLFNNINLLIKDLFYTPPIYKCNVTLSFKKDDSSAKKLAETSPSGVQKRHAPITFDRNGSEAKQSRYKKSGDNMKLYSPPSGKYSNNLQSNTEWRPTRGRPWNRGGRGGRGGNRGWRN